MQPLQEDCSSSAGSTASSSSLYNLDYHLDSINHHHHHQDNQLDLLEFPSRESTTTPSIIKIFPPTMPFDSQQTITFNSPESSSAVSYSSPSAYTPSSHSVSSFNWFTDSLSNPDVLAPTAPDLTFSFLQSTNWRTPVHKSSSSSSSNNNINTNVSSKTDDDHEKHLARVARDATPTQDFAQRCPHTSLTEEEDEEDYHDRNEKKERCFSTPPTSPLKSRTQTVTDTTPDQRAQKKQSSRPVSHMGIHTPGSRTMFSTGSERLKPKKPFGFILGNGRLRSATTCLESQLDDVLSQRSSSAFAEHDYPATTVYRRLPPQSEPAARTGSGGHYLKTRNRFSAFLSFLPSDSDQHPGGPSSTSKPSPTTINTSDQPSSQQTQARPTKPSANRRSSINLLDRATLSFSSSSFRSFNSSITDHNTVPSPYVLSPPNSAKSTSDSHHHYHHHHHHQLSSATMPTTTIAAAKSPPIKSSRSFLNLLSSKLK
ncbi:hypothetical protein PGT21_004865 [Puccinia graminis f. sp. tritici]|uniref:Uncharacterized protein n=1 Tax=Puccinia graminis f. sp. tritici TaxID=56615 RepID=A0A5B0R051_PUCGR|nr:hypothetical protein PGT21_004865 [Puccinia graminis f. sp. tritici]